MGERFKKKITKHEKNLNIEEKIEGETLRETFTFPKATATGRWSSNVSFVGREHSSGIIKFISQMRKKDFRGIIQLDNNSFILRELKDNTEVIIFLKKDAPVKYICIEEEKRRIIAALPFQYHQFIFDSLNENVSDIKEITGGYIEWRSEGVELYSHSEDFGKADHQKLADLLNQLDPQPLSLDEINKKYGRDFIKNLKEAKNILNKVVSEETLASQLRDALEKLKDEIPDSEDGKIAKNWIDSYKSTSRILSLSSDERFLFNPYSSKIVSTILKHGGTIDFMYFHGGLNSFFTTMIQHVNDEKSEKQFWKFMEEVGKEINMSAEDIIFKLALNGFHILESVTQLTKTQEGIDKLITAAINEMQYRPEEITQKISLLFIKRILNKHPNLLKEYPRIFLLFLTKGSVKECVHIFNQLKRKASISKNFFEYINEIILNNGEIKRFFSSVGAAFMKVRLKKEEFHTFLFEVTTGVQITEALSSIKKFMEKINIYKEIFKKHPKEEWLNLTSSMAYPTPYALAAIASIMAEQKIRDKTLESLIAMYTLSFRTEYSVRIESLYLEEMWKEIHPDISIEDWIKTNNDLIMDLFDKLILIDDCECFDSERLRKISEVIFSESTKLERKLVLPSVLYYFAPNKPLREAAKEIWNKVNPEQSIEEWLLKKDHSDQVFSFIKEVIKSKAWVKNSIRYAIGNILQHLNKKTIEENKKEVELLLATLSLDYHEKVSRKASETWASIFDSVKLEEWLTNKQNVEEVFSLLEMRLKFLNENPDPLNGRPNHSMLNLLGNRLLKLKDSPPLKEKIKDMFLYDILFPLVNYDERVPTPKLPPEYIDDKFLHELDQYLFGPFPTVRMNAFLNVLLPPILSVSEEYKEKLIGRVVLMYFDETEYDGVDAFHTVAEGFLSAHLESLEINSPKEKVEKWIKEHKDTMREIIASIRPAYATDEIREAIAKVENIINS